MKEKLPTENPSNPRRRQSNFSTPNHKKEPRSARSPPEIQKSAKTKLITSALIQNKSQIGERRSKNGEARWNGGKSKRDPSDPRQRETEDERKRRNHRKRKKEGSSLGSGDRLSWIRRWQFAFGRCFLPLCDNGSFLGSICVRFHCVKQCWSVEILIYLMISPSAKKGNQRIGDSRTETRRNKTREEATKRCELKTVKHESEQKNPTLRLRRTSSIQDDSAQISLFRKLILNTRKENEREGREAKTIDRKLEKKRMEIEEGISTERLREKQTGFIIKNHEGGVVAVGGSAFGKVSALEAEVRAMTLGIRKAVDLDLSSVCIEGDCLTAINNLTDRWSPPWEVEIPITECKLLCQKLRILGIKHVFRESNRTADRVAHLLQSDMSDDLLQDPTLRDLIRKDALES